MTTGIFLQRVVNDEEFLNDKTHIILDEVHERDVDIDFTLVLMKHLLPEKRFKLILMSATIDTELFSGYFEKRSVADILKEGVYMNEKTKHINEFDEYEEIDVWKNPDANWTKNRLFDDSRAVRWKTQADNGHNERAPIIKVDDKVYTVRKVYLDTLIQKISMTLKM